MNEFVLEKVRVLLEKDKSGHGMDHVMRVHGLAMKFAEKENADKNIVELAALLHDVDDYKIFGQESARHLTNANRILDQLGADPMTKRAVVNIIQTMGYNKFLEGIRPTTLEGMIVSDADMCDAIGAQGILRTHAYNASKGNPFFDVNLDPIDSHVDANAYRAAKTTHSVQHFFDKLLTIPAILMTGAGREEGALRQDIMVHFLEELFREESAQKWSDHLQNFLKKS
ncbi:TPA: metal-dependent phosphohydrolase [Candidatus Saccharibacteria bacterium]|nr:metal-dependent phosphohydrolase [Candidatus Saccharibacteria bacterium]